MKLANYLPTFRNVLLRKVEVTRTKGGIILPSTEFATNDNSTVYEVIKVGKDCIEIQPGDIVRLMEGLYPITTEFEVKDRLLSCNSDAELQGRFQLSQVMEQQIIGYFRVKKKK
jgi:co-chaperonin GroES (HSP10)